MKRIIIGFAIGMAALLVVGSIGYQPAQSMQKKETSGSAPKEQSIAFSCPMHPEVVSTKAGKCPKCGMNLVLKERVPSSAKDQILKAAALLNDAKKSLKKEGSYNCCIKGACDRCALDHQSCSCADEVKTGQAVCPDCYAGWQRGDGMVKGVHRDSVRGDFHHHSHKH